MMISGLLSAELSATCNALGYSSGSTYFIDPYVKETITDLIRYLRRDDEDHTIRRHLGCAKVLQTDLLPIMVHHSDKEELFDVLLRLLVNLTNPALLIYQEELPKDRTAHHYFLQIVSQLQSYKEAFTQQKVWEILAKKLGDLLQIEYHDRDEDQSRTMERILILARNVLQVPADPNVEKRPDNDASVHDQVLWSLHQAGMVDLFLYIASTDHEQQYYMHILEIVSLMLREQNPKTLASAALQRSLEEKERDEKELLEIRRREIMEKQSKVKKYAGSRHSRFGGTFVMKNVKSISDKDMIFHKPLSKAVTLSFDFEKQKAKVPKNKLSLSYHFSERRSAFSVRLFLKEFCVEFLNGAYNPLMYKVRENLVRAVGQENDETYYFWAMKFFMEFNRLYKFQVKLVSETMHQQIFHFVQTKMEHWLELMVTDKKKIPVISRRIHQALKAYQELLMTLQEMDRSPEESVRSSAKVIKSNIFYQSEYRELVVYLFNVFTEMKFSRGYLKDLVETAHVFLKMLEHFCSKHQNLIVRGKARKVHKKKNKSGPKKSALSAADLESLWDQVGPELSAVLQGEADIPSDIIPFDAASDLTMDQQKIEAMKRIQSELKQGNFEQAVGLLRASREVWPENDSFGSANMPVEEEFLAMRDIFLTDMGQPPETTAENEGSDNESEDENDPRNIVVPEQTFKFIDFASRFVCPRVLQPICLLLEQFDTNTSYTNHCIVKLLHRVAWDCKMPAILFQATLFCTFQRVFKSTNPEHKEIQKFAVFMVRKFAELSKNNKKIFMELLFWKSKKEAYELEVGYGNGDSKSHSAKNVWGEEQEDELRRLAAEYERENPEPDAVGWIMKNMIDQTRSRRAIIKKMKELYLVVGNIKMKLNVPKDFGEEEISELQALYNQYKDSPDTMNCILGRLSVKRSRKAITDKLLELGLITDRKELHKRPTKSSNKKSGNLKDTWGMKSDDESIYDSWSDEDNDGKVNESKDKKLQRTAEPSQAKMCCNLRRVIDAGLREPLEWLLLSLQEVLDDLSDSEDSDEGTALLPLTPTCVQAMENPVFLQLLDIFYIDKPTDQEIYWRVPGQWKAADLSQRIILIKNALDNNLPEFDPGDEEKECNEISCTSSASLINTPVSDTKRPKKYKKSAKKHTRERIESNSSSDSEDYRSSYKSRKSFNSLASSSPNRSLSYSNSSDESGANRRKNEPDSDSKNHDFEISSVHKIRKAKGRVESSSEEEPKRSTEESCIDKRKRPRMKCYSSSDDDEKSTKKSISPPNKPFNLSLTNSEDIEQKRLMNESDSEGSCSNLTTELSQITKNDMNSTKSRCLNFNPPTTDCAVSPSSRNGNTSNNKFGLDNSSSEESLANSSNRSSLQPSQSRSESSDFLKIDSKRKISNLESDPDDKTSVLENESSKSVKNCIKSVAKKKRLVPIISSDSD